ncbi:SxtJ family membrane protein [Pelagicoccus sp. SDUM812003]|uniref:SxtJ family membrane protein n=1 Tax=Pelagicoccus sp. SDUM812003 TaxID=3041267 RepID=UPI00280EC9AA|nr:SxtJ family membrane protein [Pelagicoccus sp. SDUM812003]MDQ8202623.1 SxtJ family membrane protein [Pelagicoccus sp. SDUM812003]
MSLLRINRNPSARDLRLFAGLWLVFLSGFAWIAYGRGYLAVAGVLLALALPFGALGLAAPRAIRWLYVATSLATYPIGFVISHLLLAVIYYLVVTPIGLLLKLLGKDPLQRRFEPVARRPSYWEKRGPPRSPASYFKQY